MDIKDLTPKSNTVKVELKHPQTGEPLKHNKKQMFVERYLPHTKEYKKVKYAITQKYLKRAQETDSRDIDLFEADMDTFELLAKTTSSWQLYWDGEWIELTEEKAMEVYQEAFWIADQLQEGENSADVFTQT